MVAGSQSIHYQSFLPANDRTRAFVWKHSPEFGGRRPRHFHDEPELNVVVRGWAKFGVGEAVVRVAAGELLGFPAGQDHALLESSPDLYLYAIGMDPRLSGDALRDHPGSAAAPLHVRLQAQDVGAIARGAAKIVDRLGIEQDCAELWQKAHWLARSSPSGGRSAVHVLTARASRVLSESPELNLEALSRTVRANPSEISRHFHRDLGMTLVRYRARLRLLRFIRLVDEGQGNWLEAAGAAGFGSYSQCHRTFQAELGCAPREFLVCGLREQMQQAYES